MFGCYGLARAAVAATLLISCLSVGERAQAQQKSSTVKKSTTSRPAARSTKARSSKVNTQKGVITVPEGTVFQEADFDAPVIGSLRQGAVYDISTKKKGPFYRIRVRPGLLGWISEAEVRPVSSSQAKSIETERQQTAKESKKPSSSKLKPIDKRRYRGLVLESIGFTEKTMGKKHRDNLLFYGLKFSGPNTLFDGAIETDAELLFHSGAPSYYEKATGNPASGFIMMGNFLFLTSIRQTESVMAYYGFGPTFRLSHFSTELSNDPGAGNKRSYSLDDMTLGAVFNLGVALGLGDYALRLEGRYYWETQSYTSFGLAFQKDF